VSSHPIVCADVFEVLGEDGEVNAPLQEALEQAGFTMVENGPAVKHTQPTHVIIHPPSGAKGDRPTKRSRSRRSERC
jgi:hypothetical protein